MADERITHFIWTDIAPEQEAAFNEWYTNEHMPDRVVRVPGFTRGRRFGAVEGGPKYLAYYEMANADVFWTKEYVAMRSEPDPKSRHFVALFQNALRSTSNIHAELDGGEGRWLGIAGMSGDVALPGNSGLDPLGEGLSRVRISRTSEELVQGNFKRMDAHSRGQLRPRDRVPDWVITVEGSDRATVARALAALTAACGARATIDASAVMQLLSECSPQLRN